MSPARPDNLFEPLAGDFGAHGVFGGQARETAATTWMAEHKGIAAMAGALLFSGVALAWKRRAW